jgi:hypothetical protein
LPINDPALGLSGALTTMQGQPPMTAAANMSAAGGGASGASELSRAARSLESVQGNVSGQTMAIQQMTMSGQQSASNLNMLLNQLSTQISGLNQAVMQMAGSARMGTMPAPMSQPMSMSMPAPPMQMGGGSQFGAQIGGMAMGGMSAIGQGMGMAGRGLSAAGGFFGGVGATAVSPFFGAPIHGAAAGGYGPRLGPDAGFMRSAGLASGLGMHPEMLKQASAAQIYGIGRERMQNRFQDMALAGIGGASTLGLGLAGEAAGSSIMGAMGVGGAMGLGGGMLLGGGLAALGGMAVNETMGQTASIRGFGDQFGRNAHRFMDPSALGGNALRKPSMAQRRDFGQAMNRMSIQDLTFNEQDVQGMFAGMSEQDLMRGMRSTQEVVTRMRKAKEAFKLIGQTMGQGIQEAAGTMGAMQSIGMDPMGARGRAMIFGASSVPGMDPGQAMGRATQFGGQFAGRGYGGAMANVMMGSQRGGQLAMSTGVLGNQGIAALGGREGAQGALGDLQAMFLESSMGKTSMLAGSAGMGKGFADTVGIAGNRAGGDINKLLELQMNDPKMAQEYLQNKYRARMDMVTKLQSQADVFKKGGASQENAMKLAIIQMGKESGREITGAQAGAYMDLLKNTKNEMISEQRGAADVAGGRMESELAEQLSPMARLKRGAKGMFTGAAEFLETGTGDMAAALSRGSERMEMGISGREVVNMGRGLTSEDIDSLRGRAGNRMDMEELAPIPAGANRQTKAMLNGINRQRSARNKLRGDQRLIIDAQPRSRDREKYKNLALNSARRSSKRINELKEVLNDPGSNAGAKRAAMKEALNILSNDSYDGFKADSKGGAMMKRAIQDAAVGILGVDPGAILTGNETGGGLSFSDSERGELKGLRQELADILGTEDISQAAGYESKEVQAVIAAYAGGGDLIGAEKAARDADFGSQVDRIHQLKQAGDDERGLFEGQNRFDTLAGFMGGGKGKSLMGLSRKQGASARIQATGRNAASLMLGLGRSTGDLMGLGSQNVDENLGGLGRLAETLSDEDIDKMSQMAGGQRMAKAMRAIKGVNFGDGMDRFERKALSDLIPGATPDSDFIKNINSAEDLGQVVAMATDVASPAGAPSMVTSQTKQGLTAMQVETQQKMLDEVKELHRMMTLLANHKVFQ